MDAAGINGTVPTPVPQVRRGMLSRRPSGRELSSSTAARDPAAPAERIVEGELLRPPGRRGSVPAGDPVMPPWVRRAAYHPPRGAIAAYVATARLADAAARPAGRRIDEYV